MHDALGMMANNHMLYDTLRAIAKLFFWREDEQFGDGESRSTTVRRCPQIGQL